MKIFLLQRKQEKQTDRKKVRILKDERSMKVIFVSHCLLNQNSKVFGLSTKETIETANEVISFLFQRKIGIVQMPCPEFTYLGLLRPPQTKDQYDSAGFRSHCRKLARDIVNQIENYRKTGVEVLAILGIEGSPSCGVNWTTRTGEKKTIHVKEKGIFIEELEKLLFKRKITVKIVGIPEYSKYGNLKDSLKELEFF